MLSSGYFFFFKWESWQEKEIFLLPEIFLSILKWAPCLHTSLHIFLIISVSRSRGFASHYNILRWMYTYITHTQISSEHTKQGHLKQIWNSQPCVLFKWCLQMVTLHICGLLQIIVRLEHYLFKPADSSFCKLWLQQIPAIPITALSHLLPSEERFARLFGKAYC